jgi:hypothetical protein
MGLIFNRDIKSKEYELLHADILKLQRNLEELGMRSDRADILLKNLRGIVNRKLGLEAPEQKPEGKDIYNGMLLPDHDGFTQFTRGSN